MILKLCDCFSSIAKWCFIQLSILLYSRYQRSILVILRRAKRALRNGGKTLQFYRFAILLSFPLIHHRPIHISSYLSLCIISQYLFLSPDHCWIFKSPKPISKQNRIFRNYGLFPQESSWEGNNGCYAGVTLIF